MFTFRLAPLGIALGLAASMLLVPTARYTAVAQDAADLPALGDTILTDQLTTSGTFTSGNCPTKLVDGEFAPHGFQLSVTGVCTAGDQSAGVTLTTRGLAYDDGDMVIDVQITEGYDRAVLGLHARRTQNQFGLVLNWAPSLRRVAVRDQASGQPLVSAEGQSVPEIAPGAWSQMALRVRDDRFWVLINDQLIVTGTHAAASRGGAGLSVARFGEPTDDYPVRVLWRNIRVSALADGDPGRAPVYSMPQRSQPTGAPAAGASQPGDNLAAVGAPSVPGAVVHEESMVERGLLLSSPCASGKGRSEVTPDGYRLIVGGNCTDSRPSASMIAILNGLTLPDGELRFEFKITSGFERAGLTVLTRSLTNANGTSYGWRYNPAFGDLSLFTGARGREPEMLAHRRDLRGKVGPDEWHTLAIRHHGQRHWFLIDDVPVLAADNGNADNGAVVLSVGRIGTQDDGTVVGVTFRNLRISRIEGAPDDRAPTVQRPSERPTRPGDNLSQLPVLWWSERLALVR